jgi:hypothetical protein
MEPTLPEIPESEQIYFAAIGRLVAEWNLAEANLRSLLTRLVARPENPVETMRATILTAELGAVGMEHALRALAENIYGAPLGDAIKHVAGCYARLRAYRNYYVHGIHTLITHADSGTQGAIHYLEAKSKLVERTELVDRAVLEKTTAHVIQLKDYVRGILVYLMTEQMAKRGFSLPISKLPDMPPLPSELQKPARHFGVLPPPPE